jgi:hypothetical protein
MESLKIMAGFKDIQTQFRIKYPNTEFTDYLHLWFQFSDGILFAHNYNDHSQLIAIAIVNTKAIPMLNVQRNMTSRTRNLILYAFQEANNSPVKTAQVLYSLFKLYGHYKR